MLRKAGDCGGVTGNLDLPNPMKHSFTHWKLTSEGNRKTVRFAGAASLASRIFAAAAIGVMLSGFCETVRAATFDWTPTATSTSYNWNDGLNWLPNTGFPNAAGDVANVTADLVGTTAQTINLNTAITLGTLNLGDSGTGTDGQYIIAANGGSLTFDNGASAATLNHSSQGSSPNDVISANVTIGANGLIVNQLTGSTKIIQITGSISGGNLTAMGAGTGFVSLAGNNTGWSGTVTVAQGLVNTGASANAVTVNNAVVVQQSGTFRAQTLTSVSGTLTVGSLVGGGTVEISGTSAYLNVGGDGAKASRTITVDGASAFLAPGDSTDPTGTLKLVGLLSSGSGNLAVNLTNGFLNIDLNGTGAGNFDNLQITSAATSVLTLANTFDLVLTLGYAPTLGESFEIVSIDGITAINGQFAQGTSISAMFASNTYYFSIDYAGGDGNDIVLTSVVPEPGVVGLFGLGAGLLLLGARARARRQ